MKKPIIKDSAEDTKTGTFPEHNTNKLSNPGKLISKLETYIQQCVSNYRYPTKAGFVFYLGFDSPKHLDEYCALKSKSFERFLSRAYLRLEDELNQAMLQKDRKNSNGIVRYMAAQFKEYSEKIDLKGDTSVRFVYFPNKLPAGAPMDKPSAQKKCNTKKADDENSIQ